MEIFKGFIQEFLVDAFERISHVEEILLSLTERESYDREEMLTEARRDLHTLKGNAGMMGYAEIQRLSHRLEDMVDALPPEGSEIDPILVELDRLKERLSALGQTPTREAESVPELDQARESVRISYETLDTLVELLSEMVIFRNRLTNAIEQGKAAPEHKHLLDPVDHAMTDLGKVLSFLQDKVMALRMIPLKSLFAQQRRIVHDESVREGKKVKMTITGGDTPMDKALIEVAGEALGHLIRNAVIHGIEPPEERESAGKPPEGTIHLTARRNREELSIIVQDDGRGIDPDEILEKARKHGFEIPSGESPFSALFLPGFTSREKADLSSGRGMGLSAVQDSVKRISGQIDVNSRPGEGSRFLMRLPVSVSIIQALLLRVDGEEYALPANSIIKNIRINPGDCHEMNHGLVYVWNEEIIPVVDIGTCLKTADLPRKEGNLVIIEANSRFWGLLTDSVMQLQDIVVRGVDPVFENPRGVLGSTILGDGRVILILDPVSLVGYGTQLEETG